MKIVIDIGGVSMLLSADQLDSVTAAIEGCEWIHNKYIGGQAPNNYLELIEPAVIRKQVSLRVMASLEYDGIKLITKLHLESEKK